MIGQIVRAIIEALAAILFGRRDAAQQRRDDRATGARDAAAETDQTTKEIADARSEIAARPDDRKSLIERLRRKAGGASGGGSAGPGDK